MIKDGTIDEVITIEENKNGLNKNVQPIITYEYDIQIKKVIIKHIYYPNKPKNIISSPVYYGNNIKTLCSLMYLKGSSYDAIKSFVSEATDKSIKLSKGTIYNWNKQLAENLESVEYEQIKQTLLNSLVLHVDETPIKINGEQYYIHNISNEKYTLQYVNKNEEKT